MTTESSEQSGAAIEAKHDETVTEPRALLNAPHEPEYCHPREKQLICKVDWRLLPILGALYAIALVDRVNVCGFHWHRLTLAFSDEPRSRMPMWPEWGRTCTWQLVLGTL
jgi:hypothetical protein